MVMNKSDHHPGRQREKVTFQKVHFSMFKIDHLYNVFEQSLRNAWISTVSRPEIDHLYNVFEGFSKRARFKKHSVFEKVLRSA